MGRSSRDIGVCVGDDACMEWELPDMKVVLREKDVMMMLVRNEWRALMFGRFCLKAFVFVSGACCRVSIKGDATWKKCQVVHQRVIFIRKGAQ